MFLLVYVIHGYDSFRLPWRLCCCCICCAFYVHDDVCDGLLHTDRTYLRCYKDKFFFILLCLCVYIFMMIMAYVYAIISDYMEHMFLLNMLCISCRHSWLCLWTHTGTNWFQILWIHCPFLNILFISCCVNVCGVLWHA